MKRFLIVTFTLTSLLIIVALPKSTNANENEDLCGNYILEPNEDCDSGDLNSDQKGVASFCSTSCKFFYYLDKKISGRCAIFDNTPVSDDRLCSLKFGSLKTTCTIKTGETSCITDGFLPQSSNEKMYSKDLVGELEGYNMVNNAYNGTHYIVNFSKKYSADISIADATFFEDYETIAFDLSRSPNKDEDMSLYYAFYKNNTFYQGGINGRIYSNKPTMTHFRRYLLRNDVNGEYDIRFAVCPSEYDSDIRNPKCGPIFKVRLTKLELEKADETEDGGDLPPAGYEDRVLTNIEAYNNPFPDTSLSTIDGKAAAELYRRAIIGGFPDGTFRGNLAVNRAEAAKFLLLARFGEISDATNNGKFPDVLDSQWYTKYVVTAARLGIISGHPDGTFKPADGVNTAEFLKMLTLTFDLQKDQPYSYGDVPDTSWFSVYAGSAEKYSLFPQRSSNLDAGRALTRNEVAVAIYQYLKMK